MTKIVEIVGIPGEPCKPKDPHIVTIKAAFSREPELARFPSVNSNISVMVDVIIARHNADKENICFPPALCCSHRGSKTIGVPHSALGIKNGED